MISESEYAIFELYSYELSKHSPIFEFIRQTRQIEHKKAPSYKGTMRYARGATLLPSS